MRYPSLLIGFFIVLLNIGHAWALEPIQSPSSLKEMVTNVSHGKAVLAQPRLQTVRQNNMARPQPLRVSTAGHPVTKWPPVQSAAAGEHQGLVPAYAPANSTPLHISGKGHIASAALRSERTRSGAAPLAPVISGKLSSPLRRAPLAATKPRVHAKAMFCLDCSTDKVMLAENISEPLPIASITKLLTAIIVLEEMNLDQVLAVPSDIDQVETS